MEDEAYKCNQLNVWWFWWCFFFGYSLCSILIYNTCFRRYFLLLFSLQRINYNHHQYIWLWLKWQVLLHNSRFVPPLRHVGDFDSTAVIQLTWSALFYWIKGVDPLDCWNKLVVSVAGCFCWLSLWFSYEIGPIGILVKCTSPWGITTNIGKCHLCKFFKPSYILTTTTRKPRHLPRYFANLLCSVE